MYVKIYKLISYKNGDYENLFPIARNKIRL